MLKSFLALVAAIVMLRSCPAFAEEVVRLGNLKLISHGAVSYMKEVAPRYGVKIEEDFFARGADIYSAMTSGSIDVAAGPAEGAIAARGAGAPLYAVAGVANGGYRILARKDGGVSSLADLKGRKIGVAKRAARGMGAAGEILLLAELDRNRLTWSEKPGKDVQLLYLGGAELNQALASGVVDVICQGEPWSSIAAGVELMKPSDTPAGVPARLLVMTEKLYRDKPELAATVVQIFVDAAKAFLEDKALAERYVREQMFEGTLSAEAYAAAMENVVFAIDVDPARIDVVAELMNKYGLVKMARPPRSADWVRLDLLERAKALANVD